MRKITVEIEGISPILFNRFTEANAASLEKKAGKKLSVAERKKEAKDKVYKLSPRGNLIIPADNIKKAMVEGCGKAGYKIGTYKAHSYLRATVFPEKDLDLGVKKPDGIHECSGRIPPGPRGARAIIRRPYLGAGWKTTFVLLCSDDRVTTDTIEGSIKEAGTIVGTCDHRPEYGRFKINKFIVKEI